MDEDIFKALYALLKKYENYGTVRASLFFRAGTLNVLLSLVRCGHGVEVEMREFIKQPVLRDGNPSEQFLKILEGFEKRIVEWIDEEKGD